MYAAAGGASLASRQARQRQRQEKKTQLLQAKLHPPKALEVAAARPVRSQSRQFHQLPTTYLRAPQAHGRKLSASYTGQSKLHLLPIDEGDTQSVMHMRMHSHAHGTHAVTTYPGAHHASHHPYVPIPHGRVSPKLMHRHSGSSGTTFHHSHLPKSATATLPLVSQMEATPPTTPSAATVGIKAEEAQQRMHMQVPQDSIIVTPATPMASPGHVAKQMQSDDLPEAAAEQQPLTAGSYDDDEPMHPPAGALERKCSVYRMRRSDAFEQDSGSAEQGMGSEALAAMGGVGFLGKKQLRELHFQQQYEPLILDEPSLVFKGLPNGRKWQPCAYCEEGICVCEHIECAQGRAAWLERGRRCSVQDSQAAMAAASHRRWVKRNRIQDASLGGSSDDEDFLGVLRGPSTFANAFLYVGLGTIALGLVIAFVGTGEKGFKTVELRLIGPSLIGLGLICCILRILFCICPSHCISSSKKARKKNGNKVDADHTTSLLRGENKRVSIARGPSMQKYPIAHKRSNSKMLNEGMEALRQIATTSLFMQNEQKPSANRVVPIIKEPENAADAPLEMRKLETALNVCEISDEEDEEQLVSNRKMPQAAANRKITAATTATNAPIHTTSHTTTTAKTTTTTVNEKPPLLRSSSKLSRQRVALNQQQLQQQEEPLQHTEQQSQSLSSSSTVKDSIDGDQFLMETSLMIINPAPTSTNVSEARPPPSTSSGAMSRLSRTPLTVTSIPPPPAPMATNTAHTGAIARVTSAPLSYDLPSATPHSYATTTSMSSSRSVASALLSSAVVPEREMRVRGPLGMPFSALTATGSRYSSPSSAAATTTTISLLPLPAPPTQTTATSTAETAATIVPHAPSIPGQVMPITTSQSILLPTKPTVTTTATTNQPQQHLLQPSKTIATTLDTSHMSTLASSNIFKFPAPLTSSSNSSSASSNGRTAGAAAVGTITLAPPPVTPTNKFEPELVLSPAKLGQ